jgi:uncharacterized membrane protein HdeD (DUF308 family)
MIRDYVGDWRLLVVRGLLALGFGVVTLVWPEITLWAVVVTWGVFALLDGIGSLVAAFGGTVVRGRAWLIVHGVLGVAAGVIAFVWPDITGLVMLFVIAVWAFLSGLAKLVTAIQLRREIRHEWVLGAVGVISMGFAVVLVVTPGTGVLVITWLIGWYAVVLGLALLGLAWEVRRETSAAAPGPSTRPGTPHPAT